MSSSLSAFVWPDLSQWRGLPAECSLATVGSVLEVPPGGPRASGSIGEAGRELEWLSASSPYFPYSVRVWLSGDQVILLDAEILGKASDLEALVAKLGPPAATLDSYFGAAPMPGSEWVYPELGLTLFVEPENHNPLRVVVYPATTLAGYRRDYRIVFRPPVKFPLESEHRNRPRPGS